MHISAKTTNCTTNFPCKHFSLYNIYYHLCILILYLNQLFPTGPSPPLQPSNLMSTGVRHNRATIQWTVSRIAYTPENYTVYFGTSLGSLAPFNQQRQSDNNFTATNLPFSIQLTGLSAETSYYYQVVAVNSVPGSTQSIEQEFRTRKLRKLIFLFRLYLYITVANAYDVPGQCLLSLVL